MANKSLPMLLSTATTLIFISCASNPPMPATLPTQVLSTPANNEYVIQPGDQLDIKLFYNPELNETVTVRPDGKISLQLVDEMRAAGLRPSELDNTITTEYSRELQKPAVTVIVRSFNSQKVYVGGEVINQGLVDLSSDMTPLQAVLRAGGFKETANPSAAIVIRRGPDDKPVPIPVDLKSALYGGPLQALRPNDVVYVPKSFIAQADKFVNQYVEQLLLFKGFSLGAFYDLNRSNEVAVPSR